MSDEDTIIDFTYENSAVSLDETAALQRASEERTTTSYTTSTNTTSANVTSPLLKLPGELRNRIYRIYFDDFEKQMSRRFVYNSMIMTPRYLALLHINRKLRSEAGSIFWKEIAPFHCFLCPVDQPIEAVMLSRIRDVCSLVSIRDVHMRISIDCTPSWTNLIETGFAGLYNVDFWRRRELRQWLSSLLEHIERNAGPPSITNLQRHILDSTGPDRALDGTCVRRFADFLIGSKDQGVREGENFLHIEGPLAELDWSRDNGRWAF
jgi:hypothetical protein